MRIIIKKNLKNLWQDWGLTKPVPTCHNGSMMRNRENERESSNENHYHLDIFQIKSETIYIL